MLRQCLLEIKIYYITSKLNLNNHDKLNMNTHIIKSKWHNNTYKQKLNTNDHKLFIIHSY